MPCEDRLDDVGAKAGERQKAADLWIEVPSSADRAERNDLPGDQLLHPFVGSELQCPWSWCRQPALDLVNVVTKTGVVLD
jgi:hypothetical protein